MDDLHELAQAIGNAASDRERERHGDKYPSIPMAATVYHHVYRSVMDNADEIAFVYCNSELHKTPKNQKEIDRECAELLKSTKPLDDDVKVDPMDLITVIDAHNDLHDALMDILAYARRDPENLGDADAILTDILERAQEALNG